MIVLGWVTAWEYMVRIAEMMVSEFDSGQICFKQFTSVYSWNRIPLERSTTNPVTLTTGKMSFKTRTTSNIDKKEIPKENCLKKTIMFGFRK